jgi:enediyne biosynthesis protein E4
MNSPNRGRTSLPRKRLALLALLLAGYAISVYLHDFRDAERSGAVDAAAPAGPDLAGADIMPARANPTVRQPKSPFLFAEIATSAGIDFVHFSGMTEAKHFPTAYGSGVAIFDYDNDGRSDLYFATATRLPVGSFRSGPNRLYRNRGNNQFEDATAASGLGYAGYCQGLAVGDIDNDGDPDVFLCNYGSNVLYLNAGHGRFVDISKPAGLDRPGWSTSAAFLDYDNDGDLDLYVANYGRWTLPENDVFCGGTKAAYATGPEKVRIYCSPKSITPARHTLYRNNGDLTFTDLTEDAGLARSDGRGLGVLAADLNDDGRIDLYVANDMCPNFVFLNRGDGTFDDVTQSSGAGFGPQGQTRAGMGVDAEDVDGDGRFDIFVTNYWSEGSALFINLGDGLFEDRSRTAGLFHDTISWVGWGCSLADFDSDGWPDCFTTTGHIDDNLRLMSRFFHQYAQPPLLHRNQGGKGFTLATRAAGAYFDSDHVGRGVAEGDLDNDGDVDLVVNHKDAPPALLRNDTPTKNHWIRLRLEGSRSNRDAIGARVTISAGGRTIVRQRKGGASYGSSHDPRLTIGLGDSTSAGEVTIRWPSGQVDQFKDLAADTGWLLREGSARAERMPQQRRTERGPDDEAAAGQL